MKENRQWQVHRGHFCLLSRFLFRHFYWPYEDPAEFKHLTSLSTPSLNHNGKQRGTSSHSLCSNSPSEQLFQKVILLTQSTMCIHFNFLLYLLLRVCSFYKSFSSKTNMCKWEMHACMRKRQHFNFCAFMSRCLS